MFNDVMARGSRRPRGLSARVQHQRAGFIDEDTICTAQMGTRVIDDRHQMEARSTDPVAARKKVSP